MFKKISFLVMLSFILVSSAKAMTTVDFTVYDFSVKVGAAVPSVVDSITGSIVYDTLGAYPSADDVISVDLNINGHLYTAGEVGAALYQGIYAIIGGNIGRVGGLALNYDDFQLTFDTRNNLIQSFYYTVAGGNSVWGAQRYSEFSVNVPEPATMLLFGAGLAGLGIIRKRFKV